MDHNSTSQDSVIYKIVSQTEWTEMQQTGQFSGSAIDKTDGFIHFSSQKQVKETAARHFSGQTDLLLVAIDGSVLGNDLQWEPSRGGALFPHLYKSLKQEAVLWSLPLPLGQNGTHIFPQELAK